MDCDRVRDDLGRREIGTLDPAGELDLERHLLACGGCRAYSRRMKKLVAVLEEYPEIRELPKRPAFRRLTRGRVSVIAAALLAALAVPALGPLLGPGVTLEGAFDLPRKGILVAKDSASALVAHEHRMRCRKGTRVRIVRSDEFFLEEGRLDVSGLREGVSGLGIGTPLGRIEVVGTRFVVEVIPSGDLETRAAPATFVVGVMVSSGTVTYAGSHRLIAGQGILDETGKALRQVTAAGLERRLYASVDRERELETRLAALSIEKEQLGRDLAARGQGEGPAPQIPLSPDDRRMRTRQLAQVLVRSFYKSVPRAGENSSILPDEKEWNRLTKDKDALTVTETDVDGKALSEALPLSNELGMNFFEPASYLSKTEMVEELMMAVLEARAEAAAGLRPTVEAAVRSAYSPLAGTWKTRSEERLAQAHAIQSALHQLEGSLSGVQMGDLYETARRVLSPSEYTFFAAVDSKWRAQWVEHLSTALGLDATNRSVLEEVVNENLGRLEQIAAPAASDAKIGFEYSVRCREVAAELVRQLSVRFPDRKEKIDHALDPR